MDKLFCNNQNVVSMSGHQTDTGYAAIAQVEAYWQALRGNRAMPKRSEIDPRGIEMALEYTFIIERVAPGVARIRIAGTHLNDLMGMEVRGMPLSAFFTTNTRRRISDIVEEVLQTPMICDLRVSIPGSEGNAQPKEGRMILLPLSSDLGHASRILGCFVTKGEITAASQGFTISRVGTQQLFDTSAPESKQDVTHQGLGRPVIKPVAGTNLSTPNTEFETTGKTNEKTRPPYLRLVKSDD